MERPVCHASNASSNSCIEKKFFIYIYIYIHISKLDERNKKAIYICIIYYLLKLKFNNYTFIQLTIRRANLINKNLIGVIILGRVFNNAQNCVLLVLRKGKTVYYQKHFYYFNPIKIRAFSKIAEVQEPIKFMMIFLKKYLAKQIVYQFLQLYNQIFKI